MKKAKTYSKIVMIMMLVAWTLIGCSKDDGAILPGNEYFFKFKVDGRQQEYSHEPVGANMVGNFNILGSDENFGSWLVGQKDHLENEENAITFLISDENELQANVTYTNGSTTSNKIEPELFMIIYINENGVSFSTVNNQVLIPDGGVLDAELIYTEVTEAFIKGKFSGTLYDQEDNAITISEGSFYLTRVQ